MPYQYRNAAMADLSRHNWHTSQRDPVTTGRFAIYNGQFEHGPVSSNPNPDGWVLQPTGGTIVRTNADSIAGAYCIQGTCTAGGVAIGDMLQHHLMPASTINTYVFRVSLRGNAAGTVVQFGAACYDVNKAFLANAIAYNAAPGAAWVRITQNMGAAGTAFAANTRYIRFWLNFSDVVLGSFIRADDIFVET